MAKQKFSRVFELPIGDIHTNTKLFQGRQEEFSKATYEKIMREGFDKSQDPIIVWFDEKTQKYIVISGHSRLAAAQKLYNEGDEELAFLGVKEFTGGLEEAVSYATLESNRSGTAEGLKSDIKAYKKAVKEGCNQDCLRAYFKTDSYIASLQRLSYLDIEGEFLRILDNTSTAKNFANVQKYAEWTGELRKYYGDRLTDKHEREIFYFFFNETSKLFRKDEFVSLIEKTVNHITFDPKKPLNLKNFHSKSVYQIYAETEAEQVQKEIEELRGTLEKKQKLLARTEKKERQSEIELEISGINRNIVKKIEALDRLKEQAKEADKIQLDLFVAPEDEEQPETSKEQPKTPKIEQPEIKKKKVNEIILEKKSIEELRELIRNEYKPKGKKNEISEAAKKRISKIENEIEKREQAIGGGRLPEELMQSTVASLSTPEILPVQSAKTKAKKNVPTKSLIQRIENLKILLSLNRKDAKISKRIKNLEIINAL